MESTPSPSSPVTIELRFGPPHIFVAGIVCGAAAAGLFLLLLSAQA